MISPSRPHDLTVVELLREDPALVDEYLAVAMEEVDEEGGQQALLAALRHVAEARDGGSRRARRHYP
jgi:DNA-binding phage protein